MKKRIYICFMIFILCLFHLSKLNSVFGEQSPAELVFANHTDTILREDVRPLIPNALNAFKESEYQGTLEFPHIDIYLNNPTFLRTYSPKIDDKFIALLYVDDDLRKMFGDIEFFNVMKDDAEIDKLIQLIEDIQVPTTLEIVFGNGQSGNPNDPLQDPLVVIVKDQKGKEMEKVSVTFSITSGDGQLSGLTSSTNSEGRAVTTLTLGAEPGTTLVKASVEGISETVTFIATTIPITSPPDTDTPKPPESELFVNITPSEIVSPAVGNKFTLNVNIKGGESINSYVITVEYDPTALKYLKLKGANGNPAFNGKYLPDVSLLEIEKDIQVSNETDESVNKKTVMLAAASGSSESSGDGVLAKLTFEVVGFKQSTLKLVDVKLSNSGGSLLTPNFDNNTVTVLDHNADVDGKDGVNVKDLVKVGQCFGKEITDDCNGADVNGDGVVNILDLVAVAQAMGISEESSLIVPEDENGDDPYDVNGDGVVNILDLVSLAGALGAFENTTSAPSIYNMEQFNVSAKDVRTWIAQAKALDSHIPETIKADPAYQRGVAVLENLLATLTHIEAAPQKTALLLNYPNPFNPETWIPYQLAEATDVTVTIHAMNGTLIRTLALGHQVAGVYRSKSRAAYWDGKNEFGERVASGLYFYTLTAGNFSATGKMLIRK